MKEESEYSLSQYEEESTFDEGCLDDFHFNVVKN